MAYGEARIAALYGSFEALQDKIEHELQLPTPDADRLADFKRKMMRVKDEIDYPRTKQVSEV